MIRLSNVCKSFRPYAAPKSWFHVSPVGSELVVLKDLDLHVQAGEIIGIQGANGSGKSTLLRIIAGLIEADAGQVLRQDSVSLLDTAHFHFSERLTVRQNLMFFAALRGIPEHEATARISADAGALDVNFLERRVNGLSAGMRQGLHWLLALLPRASCLLLDEPFALLDAKHTKSAAALLQEYSGQQAACIITSHNAEYLHSHCSRCLKLSGGSLQ